MIGLVELNPNLNRLKVLSQTNQHFYSIINKKIDYIDFFEQSDFDNGI